MPKIGTKPIIIRPMRKKSLLSPGKQTPNVLFLKGTQTNPNSPKRLFVNETKRQYEYVQELVRRFDSGIKDGIDSRSWGLFGIAIANTEDLIEEINARKGLADSEVQGIKESSISINDQRSLLGYNLNAKIAIILLKTFGLEGLRNIAEDENLRNQFNFVFDTLIQGALSQIKRDYPIDILVLQKRDTLAEAILFGLNSQDISILSCPIDKLTKLNELTELREPRELLNRGLDTYTYPSDQYVSLLSKLGRNVETDKNRWNGKTFDEWAEEFKDKFAQGTPLYVDSSIAVSAEHVKQTLDFISQVENPPPPATVHSTEQKPKKKKRNQAVGGNNKGNPPTRSNPVTEQDIQAARTQIFEYFKAGANADEEIILRPDVLRKMHLNKEILLAAALCLRAQADNKVLTVDELIAKVNKAQEHPISRDRLLHGISLVSQICTGAIPKPLLTDAEGGDVTSTDTEVAEAYGKLLKSNVNLPYEVFTQELQNLPTLKQRGIGPLELHYRLANKLGITIKSYELTRNVIKAYRKVSQELKTDDFEKLQPQLLKELNGKVDFTQVADLKSLVENLKACYPDLMNTESTDIGVKQDKGKVIGIVYPRNINDVTQVLSLFNIDYKNGEAITIGKLKEGYRRKTREIENDRSLRIAYYAISRGDFDLTVIYEDGNKEAKDSSKRETIKVNVNELTKYLREFPLSGK